MASSPASVTLRLASSHNVTLDLVSYIPWACVAPCPVSLQGWHHPWAAIPSIWCHAPGWHHSRTTVTPSLVSPLGGSGSPWVLVSQQGHLSWVHGSPPFGTAAPIEAPTHRGALGASGTCSGTPLCHQLSPVKLVPCPSCQQHPRVLATTLEMGPPPSSHPAASRGEETQGGGDRVPTQGDKQAR